MHMHTHTQTHCTKNSVALLKYLEKRNVLSLTLKEERVAENLILYTHTIYTYTYIYTCMQPPPPPHTHTHTQRIHTRQCKIEKSRSDNRPALTPTSQPAHQPVSQPTNQSASQHTNQSASPPANQLTSPQTSPPTSQPAIQPTNQPASPPTSQPTSQLSRKRGQTLKAAAPLPAVTSARAASTAGLVSMVTAHCLMDGYLSSTPESNNDNNENVCLHGDSPLLDGWVLVHHTWRSVIMIMGICKGPALQFKALKKHNTHH